MAEEPSAARPERLASLDVFRGIVMAGMILVNNPGSAARFSPLGHASWNGWTPTDLVFPSFLFIVGVAMTFSFDRRLAQGGGRLRLFEQVVRRTIILFLLGMVFGLTPMGFPNWRLIGPYILMIAGIGLTFADEPLFGWPRAPLARIRKTLGWALCAGAILYFIIDFGCFQASRIRVPGVLQRIAICYFCASLILMYCGVRGRVLWTAALLLGYWAIIKHVHPPAGYAADVVGPEGLLHNWIDERLLGAHVYARERPDPEGLLSTVPAVATTLLGVLAGNWLHARRGKTDATAGLFFAANVAIVLGLWMSLSTPVNKKLWTSSYVLLAGGIATHGLAMCFWLVDVKGRRRWSAPFMVFGTNAIAVYVASGFVARLLDLWKLPSADGRTLLSGVGLLSLIKAWSHQTLHPLVTPAVLGAKPIAVKAWLYQALFASWTGPRLSSLLYALAYVLLWLVLMTPLYRRRLYIKV